MTFAAVRLPTAIGLGFVGGPEFSTEVITVESGFEYRNANHQDAVSQYVASYEAKTKAVTKLLIAFFRARLGRQQGFLFKDHIDFEVANTEGVLITTGVAGVYQLWKRYTSVNSSDRKILKPVSGTIILREGAATLIESTHYTLNYTTGVVTMLGSPFHVPTDWAGQFDVPVRFTSDRMEVTELEPDMFTWGNIGMIELLNP